jgi:aryl-alcohol dehydrogenase-like predicted oxidoreductase
MQKRSLAGLDVNVVGLGTAATFQLFRTPTGEEMETRRRVIDASLAHGVTFIDSSPMYGESEGVVGAATEGRRERFQLATKVWVRGRDAGRAQIADSFRLLRTGYIDVFQVHNLLDWRIHLPELERLKAEGKIGRIGITHYLPSTYPEMMAIMRAGRIDAVQVPYNPLERTCEQAVLPLAEELGIGVIVMEPLGSGRLVAGLKGRPDPAPLREYGVHTWAQALLAWVLADRRVSVVIPGTSRPERVAENAHAGSLPPMPAELREYVSAEARRCM